MAVTVAANEAGRGTRFLIRQHLWQGSFQLVQIVAQGTLRYLRLAGSLSNIDLLQRNFDRFDFFLHPTYPISDGLPPGKIGLSDVIQVLPQVTHFSIFSPQISWLYHNPGNRPRNLYASLAQWVVS